MNDNNENIEKEVEFYKALRLVTKNKYVKFIVYASIVVWVLFLFHIFTSFNFNYFLIEFLGL